MAGKPIGRAKIDSFCAGKSIGKPALSVKNNRESFFFDRFFTLIDIRSIVAIVTIIPVLLKGEVRMATIQPKGEKLRQSVKWISGIRQEDKTKPIPVIIQEASNRFNLSPKEEDFLRSFYETDSG